MRLTFFVLLTLLLACNEDALYTNHKLPVSNPSGESSLFVNSNNELVLSWIENNGSDAQLQISKFENGSWGLASTVAHGKDWFVNWADFPELAANGQLIFAHYLQKSSSATFSYDVMFTLSNDNGLTWNQPQKLHNDTTLTEHGFVSAVAYEDGFYVTWLDGRFSGGGGHDHAAMAGAMSLRAAYVGPNGLVQSEVEIDHKTCDCCQTDIAIVEGNPFVVYRDRSDEEIRDMSFSQLKDSVWTNPNVIHNDNWQIVGCPVNGPRVVSNDGSVAVLWFTGADNTGAVKIAFSDDIEPTFGDPIILESGEVVGRVDLIEVNNLLYASWIGSSGEKYYIKSAKLDFNGNILEQKDIIEVSPGRKSGFPRIAYHQDKLFITYADDAAQSVKVISVPF